MAKAAMALGLAVLAGVGAGVGGLHEPRAAAPEPKPVVGSSAVTIAAPFPGPSPPRRPCAVALIHGSGPDLHDEGPTWAAAMERYWNPARRPEFSFAAQAGSPGAIAHHCRLLRVGYDGSQPWWHIRAAGRVASVLHDFLSRAAIADGELVIIGHSMGGLVARYIVNNGEPDAPYHNEYVERDPRMDYGLVRRKTRAVITVAAPHAGSEAADALYGGADHTFANVSAAMLLGSGAVRESAANASLTRTYLEAAGRPGGEMGDDGRTVPIWTVAGTEDRAASVNATRADRRLGWAWSFLCYRRGVANLWGLLCGQSARERPSRTGDGVVEMASAHGRWTRPVGRGEATIAGPLRPWLDVHENHSQSRYTAQSYELIRAFVAPARTREEPR